MRIKGQVLKIRACNTAQVAVLQHEWRSHECCNTATSAVLHASIFNTWPLILKYLYYLIFLFIPKKQGIFQYWPLLINTQCSRIFEFLASYSIKSHIAKYVMLTYFPIRDISSILIFSWIKNFHILEIQKITWRHIFISNL